MWSRFGSFVFALDPQVPTTYTMQSSGLRGMLRRTTVVTKQSSGKCLVSVLSLFRRNALIMGAMYFAKHRAVRVSILMCWRA